MKAPISFEHHIKGHNFIFARVCGEDVAGDQYSVIADGYIFRMTREEHGQDFMISDTDALPDEIMALQPELSQIILTNEANEFPADDGASIS